MTRKVNPMLSPNLVLLYTKDMQRSRSFYEALLEMSPTADFPAYVAFSFSSGLTLGLWSTEAAAFVSEGTGNRSELAFMVADRQAVEALHEKWRAAGVTIEQAPFDAAFGRTFVALDPDGHRLRVCRPDAKP
ncbi:VOC family protein [Tianweitania populi]|nr:VOC family protein [Tianweitania populi]